MSIKTPGSGYNGTNPEALQRIIEDVEGKVISTKKSGDFVVKKYVNALEVHVEFVSTGYKTIAAAKEVRKGSVKDPLFPRVAGVGFIGIGVHNGTFEGTNKNTPVYEAWRGILRRCYDPSCKSYSIYEDVEVCDEWHNFQNFADWFCAQEHNDKGFVVDKDLKMFGNRVYSPNMCTLVPVAVNSLFTGSDERLNPRELPKGVHFCKAQNVYVAQVHKGEVTKLGNKKQTYLGQFKDKVPAILAYKRAKEDHVKKVAEKYREALHPQVYKNLMMYEVDVSLWIKE